MTPRAGERSAPRNAPLAPHARAHLRRGRGVARDADRRGARAPRRHRRRSADRVTAAVVAAGGPPQGRHSRLPRRAGKEGRRAMGLVGVRRDRGGWGWRVPSRRVRRRRALALRRLGDHLTRLGTRTAPRPRLISTRGTRGRVREHLGLHQRARSMAREPAGSLLAWLRGACSSRLYRPPCGGGAPQSQTCEAGGAVQRCCGRAPAATHRAGRKQGRHRNARAVVLWPATRYGSAQY